MRSSARTNRWLAAAAPVGALLVSVGTAVVIAGTDAGIPAILGGILVLVVGLAGVHGLIGNRYGGLGYAGFVATQVALIAIFLPLSGLGFLLLIPAGVLLSWALARMSPPMVGPAIAILAVWPAAMALDGASSLSFSEALAVLFPLPYVWLALAARRLPSAATA